MFRIFGQEKRPPLTEYCVTLSAPANLLKSVNAMCADDSHGEDKLAIVLALVIMAAAGNFVRDLQWDQTKMWEGSRRYLRDTNLDVVTAEAIVWMYFLMTKLWKTDGPTTAPKVLIALRIFPGALQIAHAVIKKETGFDYEKRGIERSRRYQEATKDGEDISLVFASIVLHSIGRQSLAEPMKNLGPVTLEPEWSPLSLKTMLFFSTMPSAFYETFKNFLQEWPFLEDDQGLQDFQNEQKPEYLMRQATIMKWKQTSEIEEDGQIRPWWMQRSVRFERGKELAVLWHKNATITLIRYPTHPFDDFVELEKWIKENPRNRIEDFVEDFATGEILYLQLIDRFVRIHGHFFDLLETEAKDESFIIGVVKLYKAGYSVGEAPEKVAMLILDALLKYHKDRNASLLPNSL
jgi:hypothetical protein